MSLVIVGATVVDLIFTGLPRLPVWPRHTEFTTANLVLVNDPPIVTLGGNGANAAYVAARCGATVTLHTRIGRDAMGLLARQWLADAGCRLEALDSGATSVNVTAANARCQRATFFHAGEPRSVLPHLPKEAGRAGHVLACGWPHPPLPALAKGLKSLRRSGAFTALDAGPILGEPWTLAELEPVFEHLSLFLMNEYELRTIARTRTATSALKRVRECFDGDVVVKRGPDGAWWLPAGSSRRQTVASRRVRAINTVGAGDTFNGALLAGLEGGLGFPAALEQACAVAAEAVASGRGVLGIEPRAGRAA